MKYIIRNNDPISYYSPTTVTSDVYAFKDNTSYPFVAGNGIVLHFVTESGNDGYVKITNTLSSATAPIGTTGAFSLYGTNQQFKLLQVSSPLTATESNNVVTISGPNLATSQSLSSSLESYVNDVSEPDWSAGWEYVRLTKNGKTLELTFSGLKTSISNCIKNYYWNAI